MKSDEMKTMERFTVLALVALLSANLAACTHTYALRVQGQAAPGSQVKASYWQQVEGEELPTQVQGPPVSADPEGGFEVRSATVLDFAGPPPHVVLEVSGIEPMPVCAVVPTKGLWSSGQGERRITLPPLRKLQPAETVYELQVSELERPVQVMRMDTAKGRCISPGK